MFRFSEFRKSFVYACFDRFLKKIAADIENNVKKDKKKDDEDDIVKLLLHSVPKRDLERREHVIGMARVLAWVITDLKTKDIITIDDARELFMPVYNFIISYGLRKQPKFESKQAALDYISEKIAYYLRKSKVKLPSTFSNDLVRKVAEEAGKQELGFKGSSGVENTQELPKTKFKKEPYSEEDIEDIMATMKEKQDLERKQNFEKKQNLIIKLKVALDLTQKVQQNTPLDPKNIEESKKEVDELNKKMEELNKKIQEFKEMLE